MQHCAGTAVDAPWAFGGAYQAGALGDGAYSVPGFEGDAGHDILMALVDWVEGAGGGGGSGGANADGDGGDGAAVYAVVATTWKVSDDPSSGVLRQRPICAWPAAAAWDGAGDVDKASSWSCSSR